VEGWARAILGHEPQVLIYPEIGMDPMTARLASLRLAPVQAASWGHPETTGLPTIDYYLSAEDLEPEGAQRYYTERLVPLPRLGCYFEPHATEPQAPDFEAWGIDRELPLLVCPGVPFKYAPQDDDLLPEIARRLEACQFLFFRHWKRGLSQRLEERLRTAFQAAGRDYEACVRFIPWQPRASFYGILERADVYLDTVGFSGFNTALQALECGLPIVTREGRFLRGRLASGILKRLGMPDLVAKSKEEYVERAVRLVEDADYSEAIAERMAASAPGLYRDGAAIRGLEDFLGTVAGNP
jgi:predicted O-linked N-acetylglucosamine transferase (SPINDLY family)